MTSSDDETDEKGFECTICDDKFHSEDKLREHRKEEHPSRTCSHCGSSLDHSPFRCNYCDETFCTSHRLPENHECPGLNGSKKESGDGIMYMSSKKNPSSNKKKGLSKGSRVSSTRKSTSRRSTSSRNRKGSKKLSSKLKRVGKLFRSGLRTSLIILLALSAGFVIADGNIQDVQNKLPSEIPDILGPSFNYLVENPEEFDKATVSGKIQQYTPAQGIGEYYIEKNETRLYIRKNSCEFNVGDKATISGEIYEVKQGECKALGTVSSHKKCFEQNSEFLTDTVEDSAALSCEHTGRFNFGPDVKQVETDYTCSEVRTGSAWVYKDPEAGEKVLEQGCKNVCNEESLEYKDYSCTDGLTCNCLED